MRCFVACFDLLCLVSLVVVIYGVLMQLMLKNWISSQVLKEVNSAWCLQFLSTIEEFILMVFLLWHLCYGLTVDSQPKNGMFNAW